MVVEEDLDLFWRSTPGDLCVKTGFCLIEQVAVDVTELFTAATWSATGEL